MSDTNKLIKQVTFDIISIITILGVMNGSFLSEYYSVNGYIYNFKISYNYSPLLKTTLGMGISGYLLFRYY